MTSLDAGLVFSPRHLSLPSDSSSLTDALRQAGSNSTLGLSDTGKILSSALSDSYLPSIGLDDSHQVGKGFGRWLMRSTCHSLCVCVWWLAY